MVAVNQSSYKYECGATLVETGLVLSLGILTGLASLIGLGEYTEKQICVVAYAIHFGGGSVGTDDDLHSSPDNPNSEARIPQECRVYAEDYLALVSPPAPPAAF